ncbi:MAG: hypothetical protein U0074_21290 [Kouleothrix sp.]
MCLGIYRRPAADAALARFHEHTQVSTRLIHTFAEFASGNAPGEDT